MTINRLIIFKNSYNRFDSTIVEIIFSIEKSFLNFTKMKTETREFVRNRANDILTDAQLSALRDCNKVRFVATTITTTQTFFQKHFIANVTNESLFLSKNENDENVTENEIEKKRRFISNNFLKSKNQKTSKLNSSTMMNSIKMLFCSLKKRKS